MENMYLGAFITLGIFMIGQLGTFIWWMATVTTTLKGIDEDLKSNFKYIEKESEKREKEMSAMWQRIDELKVCKNYSPKNA